ncbi:MAG: hypothetical protein KC766_07160 [Myxococcales bacterium]|nr:hypothetical protein [Myxococcales bacterium]
MPRDALHGLFKRNQTIDLPGGEAEQAARQLAVLGLLALDEHEYVRCVNPVDPDQRYLKDASCDGRIVIRADKDPDNHDYQCPDCNRVVFPNKKRKAKAIRLIPDTAQMQALVRREAESLGRNVREHPQGLFRIEVDFGDVEVCLVDICFTSAVFQPGYHQTATIVYVVGNDRDHLRRVPQGADVFRVADLALERTNQAFRRRLRELARLDAPASPGPAVLGLPAPMAAPSQPTATGTPHAGLVCPPGTRWNQVQMYQVDGTTLAIRVPGHRLRRFSHQELELSHARNGKPTKPWLALVELCEQNGTRRWTDPPQRFNAFKQVVSQLRAHLQSIFGIQEDPFDECSKENGLRAAFTARDRLPDDETYVGEAGDPATW